MIDPKSVVIMTPSLDGNVCCDFAGGLVSCFGLYAAFRALPGCSEINLARCVMIAEFLASSYEWVATIDADIGFKRKDFEYLVEGDDLAVVAEYSKKDGSGDPNQFGMGFARIHRDVFAKIFALSPIGEAPMVNYFDWRGKTVYEFFPSFADAGHHWSGEDHSFWKLVSMTGVIPRVETRTRLMHWGRVGFPYEGPRATNTELPAL